MGKTIIQKMMIELINNSLMRNLGLVLILISLLFSWVLVIYRYILKVDEKRINTEYILKGHIDFFLMGILLIVFSLLGGKINVYFILLTCLGAITNPTMFIVLAFNPTINKSPKSSFGIITTISYVISTIGVVGVCMTYLLTK
jgi:hypothetical protein